MPLGEFKHVFVRNIKLSLLEIWRSIGAIVFIEREQAMFTVSADMVHKVHKPIDQLRIGLFFVSSAGRTHVDFELETMKRVFPRAHFSINESSACADAGDVNVMIY